MAVWLIEGVGAPQLPELPLVLLLPLLTLEVRDLRQPFADGLLTGCLGPLVGVPNRVTPLLVLPPRQRLGKPPLLPHVEQPLAHPLHPRTVCPRLRHRPLALRHLLHRLQLVRRPLTTPIAGVRPPLVPLPLHKVRRPHLVLPLLPAGGGPLGTNLVLVRLPLRLPLLRLRLPGVPRLRKPFVERFP